MFTISKAFTFCYGHRLPGDASKCRHLHGHTGKAVVHLSRAELDERGMVLHFRELTQSIGAWIDEQLDHMMLLHADDPLVAQLRAAGEPVLVVPFRPTAENIARMIFDRAREFNLPVVKVEMFESETSMACYEG